MWGKYIDVTLILYIIGVKITPMILNFLFINRL